MVDGDRQGIKFVARSSDWKAAREIPGHDLLTGAGDGAHPPHQPAAQPQAHERSQERSETDGPQRRCAKALLELAPFGDFRADEEAIAVRKFYDACTYRIVYDSAVAQRLNVELEPA